MQKNVFTTRNLVMVAVLVAISVVLKSFLSIETQVFRVTFFDIPLMVLGLTVGPLGALVGGFIVDWLHVMYSPFAFSFNLMTVSTMMWGFIPAIFLFRKKVGYINLTMAVILTSLICFSLNSIQLYIWLGSGMFSALPIRIITLLVKLPIQIFLVKAVMQAYYMVFPSLSDQPAYGFTDEY